MEKKYLNEESYHKGKKFLIVLSIIILIIGLFFGGLLIKTGFDKYKEIDNSSSEQFSLEELEEEKNLLNNELIVYKAERSKEFQTNGFSEEYYRLDNEIQTRQSRIMDIELQISKINSGFYDVSNHIEKAKSIPYFMFGGFIIIATFMISGSVLFMAYRRNIMAFGVQQVMPIAKEGIDEMAPVMGSAAGKMVEALEPTITKVGTKMAPIYGEIAKEVTKGIKEGLQDENKKE